MLLVILLLGLLSSMYENSVLAFAWFVSSSLSFNWLDITKLVKRLFGVVLIWGELFGLETLIFIEKQYEEIVKSTVGVQKILKSKIDQLKTDNEN